MTNEVNILIGDGVEESDRDLFFGPLTSDDAFIAMPPETRWPEVMAEADLDRNTPEARKNGWNKGLSEGFTDVKVGKANWRRICILKIL